MNLDILHKILRETCAQLRKGELVTETKTGGLNVTEIYDMPKDDGLPSNEHFKKVDVHFITVIVNMEEAERNRTALIEQLDSWPDDSLAGGPSYITVGGVIGDQGAAFMLFALGEALGIWTVITPATFGLKGAEADQAAGIGYIMCSGYRPD